MSETGQSGGTDHDASPPADPWKGFRGVCSGILILEMIVVLLAIPVAVNFSDIPGPSWLPTVFVLCAAALLFWACAVQSKPWAFALDFGLQFVLVAGWLLHPAIGVTGLVFVVVWSLVWWMRRGVRKAQGSRGNT
ncbi:conserved hypothetical protein [Segniliparus rotundus DSM 44985]|uniref:DUF4233 domain-containing protein n=1 Tax=Segniliparus rotundus (strain ATCC BAA-972 / CDC 1076 / CIP 108378 / DSM 44985 / JCM 13578) TaxID=640132 RepID=D6Z8D8_SEGRD|nr:DUF4233 domain-containing protein [Segniliparus rotundus]ADG98218.1 conserved hypothetical protein [Segniliparus rotundus DSM 44985]